MAQTTVTIEIDSATAKAFASASAEERRKLELLLGLRLRELASLPAKSLNSVVDEIGTKAEARGITDSILDSLLNGE
jgi:hypothetical protein